MRNFRATVALHSPKCVLAEGPVWCGVSQQLPQGSVMWVDIAAGTVFHAALLSMEAVYDTVMIERTWQFDGMVGAAVPGPDDSILVAARDRLVIVAQDRTETDGPIIVSPGDASRCNDGACDPAGRFLIGTVTLDELGSHDRLVRVEDDGTLRTLDTDLSISNGLAWSPDGRTLYNADTLHQVIWARDYDAGTEGEPGAIGPRREQFRLDGYPDGICVDADGNIWVAVWGTGEVRCYSLSGEVLAVVEVPAPHVSSVCFVGEWLDRLLITTASRDLDESGLEQYPDAGRLFLADLHGEGIVGAPTYHWSGSWAGAAVLGEW
jgi:sugar lactone lactonase YvrE